MSGVTVLLVVSDYRAGEVSHRRGAVLHLDPEEAARLQRDAPGCFEVVDSEPQRPAASKGPASRERLPGARDRLARGGAERAAQAEAAAEGEE